MRRVQYAKHTDLIGRFSINHDIIWRHRHFARAGNAARPVSPRVGRQFRDFQFDLCFKALSGVRVVF